MRLYLRSLSLLRLLILGCLVPAACSPVREDRTITFSSTGERVGFQHGRDGLFVAAKDGGGLIKIFTPSKDVIATSTPLWAPNDERLIFTTARTTSDNNSRSVLWPEDPAGGLHFQQPVLYTCWLREAPQGDREPRLRELFTAACDHPGYVTANLAVRWHPEGTSVFHVKKLAAYQYALFEYDLRSGTSRRVFPAAGAAAALVFDWAPSGSHLVCVLAGTPGRSSDGIWVGRSEQADWWHVRESSPLADAEWSSELEKLRATRPAWTADGSRFAFASHVPGKAKEDPGRHFLWMATLDERKVELLLDSREPMHSLHWRPDGERIGFLSGRDKPVLQVAHLENGPTAAVSDRPVRTFAGWDGSGRHLAYTTADDIPLTGVENTSFLLRPDPQARDAVCVASGDGAQRGRAVLSGMRATFLNWSPKEDRLSLWLTFAPTHRSLFSELLGWGLRLGDPAAVLDVTTGHVGWMAVNPFEKAQVGHYHLLKRNYAEAWRWYEDAERALASAKTDKPREPFAALLDLLNLRDDFTFFRYYCLHKLGRKDEAAVRLRLFEERFRGLEKEFAELVPSGLSSGDAKEAERSRTFFRTLVPLVRDLYEAEVFLSLDAAADGKAFFREALARDLPAEEHLSRAIVLAQVLQLQQSDGEYAALVSDVIAPQVLKSLALAAAPGGGSSLEQSGSLGTLLGILTVLPLTSADLASRLSDDQARRLVDRWETLRQEARGDATQLYVDLVLRSGYGRLGLEAERQQVVRRLNENPARAELFPKGVDDQAVDVLLSVVCQSLNELQKAAARLRELGIDMNRLP